MNPNIPAKKVHNVNTPYNRNIATNSIYIYNRIKRNRQRINDMPLILSLTLLILVKIFVKMQQGKVIAGDNLKAKKITETKRRNKQITAQTRPRNSVNKIGNISHKLNRARLIRDPL